MILSRYRINYRDFRELPFFQKSIKDQQSEKQPQNYIQKIANGQDYICSKFHWNRCIRKFLVGKKRNRPNAGQR